ncbi:MAG TPA: hypothetical protein VN790_01095 [Steroidobacteraceae bacterium]|nr:hypothetical protein [Steroidobacteraceae bacterium]
MYLPRRLYELLPYAYVVAGLLLCIGSYLGSGSVWSNSAFAVGGLAIVAGVVLILRRRSYRDDAARYDPHSLDD